MTSGVFTRLCRAFTPLRFRSLPPVPQGRQTTLAPFDPAVPQPPPELPPLGLSADELALVTHHWRLHLRHHPDLTWPRFLEILAFRERFFAEERAAREAKLANLQDTNR